MTTTALAIPLAEKSQKWLQLLDQEIWNLTSASGNEPGSAFERRPLSAKEWSRVLALIKESELPCELYSDVYGRLGIRVFAHPVVLGVPAERICFISQDHLPGFSNKFVGYDKRHPAAWKIFSPLTHSPRNMELLTLYGLEPSREEMYYEY